MDGQGALDLIQKYPQEFVEGFDAGLADDASPENLDDDWPTDRQIVRDLGVRLAVATQTDALALLLAAARS